MTKKCTYCPSGHGITDDHIPPKGFFQKPYPNDVQLITVPCCEPCRLKDQSYDGFIRNLFCSFIDTEGHPVIEKDIALRRNRSFKRDLTLVQQLTDIMVNVDVHTQAGLYIGKASAFNLNLPAVDKFIERVCRAVIFDAFMLAYFPARFEWRLNPPIPDSMISVAPHTAKQKNILDVFHYLVTPASEDGNYWVILTFYNRLRILGKLKKTEHNKALWGRSF